MSRAILKLSTKNAKVTSEKYCGRRCTSVLPQAAQLFPSHLVSNEKRERHLISVAQTMDSTIHQINLYPVSDAIGPSGTYLLYSDFYGGYGYPTQLFKQLGPVDIHPFRERFPWVNCPIWEYHWNFLVFRAVMVKHSRSKVDLRPLLPTCSWCRARVCDVAYVFVLSRTCSWCRASVRDVFECPAVPTCLKFAEC